VGLEEVEIAANLVQEAADPNALIIFGATFDESLEDEIVVTVIATGFDEKVMNAKMGGAPAEKPSKSAGRSSAPVSEPAASDDDPYKEIFKIFNRDR
jgi:cell division protein FtsZ